MTNKLFQNASDAFKLANPSLSNGWVKVHPPRRQMNKTEAEFRLILEAQKQEGRISRYEYEGITLRWAGLRYTPDFIVFPIEREAGLTITGMPVLIEVKGAFIKGKFERAVERFRHARTYWPEFEFEMHQKKGGTWKRIM